MQACMRRLPLKGLCNARELGGFPAKGGKTTNYRCFVRSEVPRKVTEDDISYLRDYGMTCSVDLRGDQEVERMPSLLKDLPWARYVRAPMFTRQAAMGAQSREEKDKYSRHPAEEFIPWGELYINMVEDYPQWTKTVLELAADEKGTMLYHCTTGKDRTGILTALLLSIAGVDRDDIIADYCVSQVYMRPVYIELMELMPPYIDADGNVLNPTIDSPFFRTAPENMRQLLDHFDSNYGGAVQFAMSCGADRDTIEAIRHKLTD